MSMFEDDKNKKDEKEEKLKEKKSKLEEAASMGGDHLDEAKRQNSQDKDKQILKDIVNNIDDSDEFEKKKKEQRKAKHADRYRENIIKQEHRDEQIEQQVATELAKIEQQGKPKSLSENSSIDLNNINEKTSLSTFSDSSNQKTGSAIDKAAQIKAQLIKFGANKSSGNKMTPPSAPAGMEKVAPAKNTTKESGWVRKK